MKKELQEALGNIDIYLFDQLLKGRFDDCHSIIDIGCGTGRNLVYFLKNNFQVFGVDQDVESIDTVKRLSAKIAPDNPSDNFRVGLADDIPFDDSQFDIAVSSAVLHFARDEAHFDSMVRSAWRVLKPGGFLFARLASDTGIETKVVPLGNRRYRLPDGSDRFLVNEEMLLNYTDQLQGMLYENIKTTNVQNIRCMTTWCIQKNMTFKKMTAI